MHFGGKRIVHFVIKQVAALFADRDQRAYCFVFFFKTLRHKLLQQSACIVPKANSLASRLSAGLSGYISTVTAKRSTIS